MDARTLALAALQTCDPSDKCVAVHALWAGRAQWRIVPEACLTPHAAQALPGRPARPTLRDPRQVPSRSVHTPEGRAALVHAIAHIEFNAINLALDAVWRFGGMPEAYYRDWLRVAHEETTHFEMLQALLRQQGHGYGDFDAHDGLWSMCTATADDVVARMALVPRTLEARGLDATPLIQSRLREVDSPDARAFDDALAVILRDEVGHVAVGNHWYGWLCAQQGLAPLAHYRTLAQRHRAPRLRPPFNQAARQAAGFTAEEMAALAQDFSPVGGAGRAGS